MTVHNRKSSSNICSRSRKSKAAPLVSIRMFRKYWKISRSKKSSKKRKKKTIWFIRLLKYKFPRQSIRRCLVPRQMLELFNQVQLRLRKTKARKSFKSHNRALNRRKGNTQQQIQIMSVRVDQAKYPQFHDLQSIFQTLL